MLAAIPGELIGLVIFAVAALLKWLGDRAAEQEVGKTPPPIPQTKSREAGASTRGDEEAERRRRFMEALGIPAEDLLTPTRETPPALRPRAEQKQPPKPREGRTKPIPPIIFQEPAGSRQRKVERPVRSQPVPKHAPPLHRPAPEPPGPVPVGPVETDILSSVTQSKDLALGDITEQPPGDTHSAAFPSLREELHDARAVQRAFVLKEILGPPLGLQSVNSLPSFREP